MADYPVSDGTKIPGHDAKGSFTIAPSDKTGRDFRAKGRLQYVGKHHLQFAGTKEYFLKAGPDAPETLLAYADFDGTEPGHADVQRSGEAKPTNAFKTGSRTCATGAPAIRHGRAARAKG